MKHTPGPWVVEVLDTTTNIESKYQTVAVDVSNCDANVIAAAPDMLKALRYVANDDGCPYDVAEIVLKAIAKAEGV